jgi:uncharacterized membrane protein
MAFWLLLVVAGVVYALISSRDLAHRVTVGILLLVVGYLSPIPPGKTADTVSEQVA